MATKTKPRTKPQAELYTWAVNIDGQLTNVVAQEVYPDAGGLYFETDNQIVRAVASGHWVTVDLILPAEHD